MKKAIKKQAKKSSKSVTIKSKKTVSKKAVIKTSIQSTAKNTYSRSKKVNKGDKIYLASSMKMLEEKTGYTNINKAITAGIKALNSGKARTIYGVLQSKHHKNPLEFSNLVCVFNLRGNKVDNTGNLVTSK